MRPDERDEPYYARLRKKAARRSRERHGRAPGEMLTLLVRCHRCGQDVPVAKGERPLCAHCGALGPTPA